MPEADISLTSKPKVGVAGTSFLMPGNPAWKNLGSRFSLSFADIDDWSLELFERAGAFAGTSGNIWCLCLDDVVPKFSLWPVRAAGVESAEEIALRVLAPLESYLRSTPQIPIIVPVTGFSSVGDTVVRAARGTLEWKQVEIKVLTILESMCAKWPHLYLIDVKERFAEVGTKTCFDNRNFYAARCRYSAKGLRELSSAIECVFQRMYEARKKVLVLDCDNTLWGGVVGEAGLQGIELGQDGAGLAFRDFQKVAKWLGSQGVILAVASKNNEPDVLQVFSSHSESVLKQEDFVSLKINWNDKAQSITEIAQELDLGLSSFVFWDDNPLERESVRRVLPMVDVIEPAASIVDWPIQLSSLHQFSQFSLTNEDRAKVAQYKAQSQFKSASFVAGDKIVFLKSIELRPTLVQVDSGSVQRAAQLCEKTNQFNLRTRRHSLEVISSMANDPSKYKVFLVRLEDKFGDHGLVGLAAIQFSSVRNEAFLDTFLLSCRVLGRHLEAWLLEECRRCAAERGTDVLLAEFIPSNRNQVAQDFLRTHGLSETENARVESEFTQAKLGSVYRAEVKTMKIPFLEAYAK